MKTDYSLSRYWWGVICVGAIMASVGCTDASNQAAKERIFSPEEPPKAKLAAAAPLSLDKVATNDQELIDHILTMTAAESFERIGPFRYSASVSFEWAHDKDQVKLAETRTIEQASASSFHVRTENSHDYGLEILRVDNRTFARSKYHQYRERKRDRNQAWSINEDVFGALSTAQSLCNHRLTMQPETQETVDGRQARRFKLAIADRPLAPAATKGATPMPAIKFPANGPDSATKRRLDFAGLRTPQSVTGSLWVDQETGVVLRVNLSAVISASDKGHQGPALLTLRIKSQLQPSGLPIALAAPKDFLADEDRPSGIAATLDRFEVHRADGGMSNEKTNKPSAPSDEPEE